MRTPVLPNTHSAHHATPRITVPETDSAMRRKSRAHSGASLYLFAALFLAFISVDAGAQQFQTLFGGPNEETGRFGVRQVSTGGYVAVGSSKSTTTGTADVYVVWFNQNGVLTRSITYDFGGGRFNDYGRCIVECINGDFAIVGTTEYSCDTTVDIGNAFFLRINAAGTAVVSAAIYGEVHRQEEAWRLKELAFGNDFNTRAGDFIICGQKQNTLGDMDGYLLRVDQWGMVIWDGLYGETGPSKTDMFADVIEANFLVENGDIIATGSTTSYNAGGVENGWIVRVNGNTGLIGAAPQGIAVYGGNNRTSFGSIMEQTVAANGGVLMDLFAVGWTDITINGAPTKEIYAVKTAQNPCIRKLDKTHGNRDIAEDFAATVREMPANAGQNPGHLIISGYTRANPATANSRDAILLELSNVTLLPGVLGYKAYGGFNTNNWEYAYSVHPIPGGPGPGYLFCGDWGPTPPTPGVDPSQMYIVKTNLTGAADPQGTCNTWTLPNNPFQPNYTPVCTTDTPVRVELICPFDDVTITTQTWWNRFCFGDTLFLKQALSDNAMETTFSTSAPHPNPITVGGTINLQMALAEADDVEIIVSNVAGRVVQKSTESFSKGINYFDIPTKGWTSGTYQITVNIGGRSETRKVVVIGR